MVEQLTCRYRGYKIHVQHHPNGYWYTEISDPTGRHVKDLPGIISRIAAVGQARFEIQWILKEIG